MAIKAVVQKVISEDKRGPFAVATPDATETRKQERRKAVRRLRVYYCGQKYGTGAPKHLVDQVPKNLESLVEAVVEKMRERNPICCLKVEIDEDRREIVASTCFEYVEEKVRFGFKLNNGKVDLIQLPPATFNEEVQQA